MGAKLLSIPPRSPDINCIEKLFHIVQKLLEQDAVKYNITFETYDKFSERVVITIPLGIKSRELMSRDM